MLMKIIEAMTNLTEHWGTKHSLDLDHNTSPLKRSHTPRILEGFSLIQGGIMKKRDEQVSVATVKKQRDIVIVMPQSRMDIFVAPLLVKQFNQLLDEGNTRFIVDLSNVRVVEAEGDYPLLHMLKRSHDVGGRVVLVCPQGNPIRILYELIQFDQLFDIVETLNGALERFEE